MDAELQNYLLIAVLRVAGGIVILLVGRWLAGVARRLLHTALRRTHATPSLIKIAERTAFDLVLLCAIFIALVTLGISAQVLITIIGVVVIVAVVALRETLRDLAATLIFIVFQPFVVGDQIETNGVVGSVQEILLFNTVLITLDNRKLIIPNSSIQYSNLTNYTAQDQLRLDLSVPVRYSDALDLAKATLLEVAHADERVLAEPPPVVDLMELGESRIKLVLRVYTKPADFWALLPALNEQVKREFDRRGLSFPFPQMELHVDQTLPAQQAKTNNEAEIVADKQPEKGS
ncbi:MAG TPA: mechanosensitive ion channel family protein [Caldilineaceae bacterium]|nr:mechanosensitive ion channel family protein [Caldilineaceae bacterium]